MAALVGSYECEWAAVVRDPERRRAFRAVVNVPDAEPKLGWVEERGQRRPADWVAASEAASAAAQSPASTSAWTRVAAVADVPRDGGITYRHGALDVAVFRFASRDAWYATEATCPHRGDAVLGRGLLGSHCGVPKVACPLHKRTFSLETGEGLSDPSHRVRTFAVEVRGEDVWVLLPPSVPHAVREDAHAA
jgi:NAD(P)H-dependent nitrite reductase small subunit